MALHEFKCRECKKIFERLLINGDKEEEVQCPFCNEKGIDKIISKSNFVIHGFNAQNKYSKEGVN